MDVIKYIGDSTNSLNLLVQGVFDVKINLNKKSLQQLKNTHTHWIVINISNQKIVTQLLLKVTGKLQSLLISSAIYKKMRQLHDTQFSLN